MNTIIERQREVATERLSYFNKLLTEHEDNLHALGPRNGRPGKEAFDQALRLGNAAHEAQRTLRKWARSQVLETHRREVEELAESALR